MQIFFPDTPDLPLPAGHRFPSGKYRLLLDTVRREAILPAAHLTASPMAAHADLLRAHDADYIDAMLAGTLSAAAQRRIGLPWSEVMAVRAQCVAGGAVAAARAALRDGLSGQLAGGTHHAHQGFGSGFCTFNDLAVAAMAVLADGSATRVAILDLDVHQGDGNAAILAADPRVLVVSVHGEKNFPFRKVPSDHDFGLADGTEDRAYLGVTADALTVVTAFRPDLVLYLAGVDPLACDRLGRLALTHDGLAERDRLVLQGCRRLSIPVAIAAGGGYAEPITQSVAAYANTWRVAAEIWGVTG